MSDVSPESAPRLLAPLLAYARERGAQLDDPLLPMSPKQLGAFVDAVATALAEPHLGLLLPTVLQFPRYELPELAARSSATMRDAMNSIVRYSTLMNETISLRLEEHEGIARLHHRDPGHPRGLSRHLNELAMAMGVVQCASLSGQKMHVREVHFLNARPHGDIDPLKQMFGNAVLEFGHAENTLTFDAAILDAPVLTADPRMLATVEGLAEAALKQRAPELAAFAATVERKVRGQLEAGQLNVRALAISLHMSTRTLQRRLDSEGTTLRRARRFGSRVGRP